MTITNVDNDCTILRITSPLITAFIAQSPTFDHKLRITQYINCGTTATVTTIEDTTLLNLTDSSFDILTPTTGVYSIKLEKLPNIGAEVTMEYSCYFLDCSSIDCDVISYTAENLDKNIVQYYTALTYANGCDAFPCNAACRIYTHLMNILGNTSDCGCS